MLILQSFSYVFTAFCFASSFHQVLLQGEAFSGKTALMAHTAVSSGFPFIRKIAADEMIGMGEVSHCMLRLGTTGTCDEREVMVCLLLEVRAP